MTQFKEEWDRHFSNVPPLGFVLRTRYPHRWTRFHALPKSKRFAENSFERRIIRNRADVLAQNLFQHDQDLWLVSCEFENLKTTASKLHSAGIESGLEFQGQFHIRPVGNFFEEATKLSIYARKVVWDVQAFSDLLLRVADDKTRALWFSPRIGRVFAPYDGGFDLLFETNFRVKSFEMRHRSWLPDLDSKL